MSDPQVTELDKLLQMQMTTGGAEGQLPSAEPVREKSVCGKVSDMVIMLLQGNIHIVLPNDTSIVQTSLVNGIPLKQQMTIMIVKKKYSKETSVYNHVSDNYSPSKK